VARHPLPAGELDVADWKWVMDINVNGVMACTRAVVGHLGHGSSIVNLASIAGLRGSENASAYSASKSAVIGISKVTARDYGRK
jgi:NAD(P)-dependent dehydrogenase (short-subunit alcohol dehydrogenase family)